MIILLLVSINMSQYWTEEQTPPSESTLVEISIKEKELNITFVCLDKKGGVIHPIICKRDELKGDEISVILDPMNTGEWGYKFTLNSAGVQSDAFITNDGRSEDCSWDGVWYSAVKITDYGYNVEMKIPYKTLRFAPGIDSFGLNIIRYIPKSNECDSWTSLNQHEGNRVSKCGVLKGIKPEVQGLYLEVYPVGIARYEGKFSPQGGFDINWDFTSSAGISFTIFPDFAQIEARPYRD